MDLNTNLKKEEMKDTSLIICLFLVWATFATAQETKKIETSLSGGIGYISDQSGDGGYQYITGAMSLKKNKRLYGGFIGFTNVDVTFNDYNFKAKEYTIGPSLIGWGKFSKNFEYSFWLMPGLKIFRDHGNNTLTGEIAEQRDGGTYSIFGANLTDTKNRWFNNYKLQVQFQKNFWSKRIGWTEGNIADHVNYKAVNKAYFKTQAEVAVKRFDFGQKGRFEPKVVLGELYDWGSKKNYLEFGIGAAISFTKNERYYEPFNLQYRARYGVEFKNRLDVIELNSDLLAIYRLIKK